MPHDSVRWFVHCDGAVDVLHHKRRLGWYAQVNDFINVLSIVTLIVAIATLLGIGYCWSMDKLYDWLESRDKKR